MCLAGRRWAAATRLAAAAAPRPEVAETDCDSSVVDPASRAEPPALPGGSPAVQAGQAGWAEVGPHSEEPMPADCWPRWR